MSEPAFATDGQTAVPASKASPAKDAVETKSETKPDARSKSTDSVFDAPPEPFSLRAPDEAGKISVASAVSSALHSRPRPPLFEVPEVPAAASPDDATAEAAEDAAPVEATEPELSSDDSAQGGLPLPLPSERPEA